MARSGPGKPGRPRLPASRLSKWGAWKRGQRELPTRVGYIRHHLKRGTYGPPTKGNTVLLSRAAHAALHNKHRRKGR